MDFVPSDHLATILTSQDAQTLSLGDGDCQGPNVLEDEQKNLGEDALCLKPGACPCLPQCAWMRQVLDALPRVAALGIFPLPQVCSLIDNLC